MILAFLLANNKAVSSLFSLDKPVTVILSDAKVPVVDIGIGPVTKQIAMKAIRPLL